MAEKQQKEDEATTNGSKNDAAATNIEKKIPVFTVLKNNTILKNIFLLHTPPAPTTATSSINQEEEEEKKAVLEMGGEYKETLLVGRQPDCNIILEHPSISRFHLRIHSKASSLSLSVIDLSSVHGTWVSGKKIEPGVRVELNEGDTLKLGGSSRIYRLHWIPLSRAYDLENPFVPQLDEYEPVEEREEETHQTQTRDDDSEELDSLFSDMNVISSVEELIPSAPSMPEEMSSSFYNEEEVGKHILCGDGFEYCESSALQACRQPDKDNSTANKIFAAEEYETVSSPKYPESPLVKSAQISSISIWSRRGKPASVRIQTDRGKERSTPANVDSEVKSVNHDNNVTESISKNLFHGAKNDEEEIFTTDKENCTPNTRLLRSFKKIGQDDMKDEPILKSSVPSGDEDDEIFTPDKENITPKSMKKMGKLEEAKHLKLCRSSPVKNCTTNTHVLRSLKKIGQEDMKDESIPKSSVSSVDGDDEIFTPDKKNITPKSMKKMGKLEEAKHLKSWRSSPLKNCTPNTHLLRSSKKIGEENIKDESIVNSSVSSVDRDDEIFTPDKENITPKSVKKMGRTLCRSSPLKNVVDTNVHQKNHVLVSFDCENQPKRVLEERKYISPTSSNRARLVLQTTAPKCKADRVPFQSLLEESTSKTKMQDPVLNDNTRSTKSNNHHQIKPFHNGTVGEENRRWTMVVDTASLLNKESRKALKLLQGLKGTNLIIPRIVVRELDCMKRRGTFFKRTSEVSSALQWIEDCMVNAKWWIHVQSSAEESRPIAPTPPASPLSHWSEEHGMFSASSVPISPYGTLLEIISPTAEDHILECALFYRRITHGQLVLLSDDVTLKIKAMAEGLLCETAEQFRESLVNPFSERFLWTDSSPRGPTWSSVDDVVLREKYYHGPLKKPSRSGECAKGLKLILLHNSQYRQIS